MPKVCEPLSIASRKRVVSQFEIRRALADPSLLSRKARRSYMLSVKHGRASIGSRLLS